ncbi:MAG: transposase [Chloroflexi bacterium]|nr:transposase [Chloroflexota bacterium]MCI0577403.1 transposase [Chloroflexota bacterium]MCI0649611.1 transposase [Chloroflexota bacterium]MCI0725379.1 transposase [Chloroflexota bacterium]
MSENLPAWFDHYNGRQTIEAGIKEGKQVFYLHRLKVRSEPAIYLQQAMVLFAANFIRLATCWLAPHALPLENALDVTKLGVKRQVHVAAHVSAEVVRDSVSWLLTFSECSAFAGKVLALPSGDSPPPLQNLKNDVFVPFLMKSHLIAQPLG